MKNFRKKTAPNIDQSLNNIELRKKEKEKNNKCEVNNKKKTIYINLIV